MKLKLKPEAPVFTLDMGDKEIHGMQQVGQLGPVLQLQNKDGLEAYVLVANRGIAHAFAPDPMSTVSATLIEGNAAFKQAVYRGGHDSFTTEIALPTPVVNGGGA